VTQNNVAIYFITCK